MMMYPMTLSPVSESACIAYFGDSIDTALPPLIEQYAQAIRNHFRDAILNCTPSYTSLMIEYHPLRCSLPDLAHFMAQFTPTQQQSDSVAPPIAIPAFYDPRVAPDLVAVAKHLNLSLETVIKLHCATVYTVCAIGFAPGFAFLAQVDPKLQVSRLPVPRKKVPKGSIGIANEQTAIYPSDTPGGWQIIGNSPIELFDQTAPEKSLLSVGQTVQFHAINEAEFIAMGGSLCLWS